ncbi:Fusaric acid resistance protein family [Serratia liquefaciens]|nr:Fusaric acid resistance protein family [Serratia liquefaciens]
MINISDSYELWVIAQSRVCEVIVGILCGGLMMMILPSTSDGSNLLTALKTMHAGCWSTPACCGCRRRRMPFAPPMRA